MSFKFCLSETFLHRLMQDLQSGGDVGLLFWLFSTIFSSLSLMKPSNHQLYLVLFCAWLCLLKSNIARSFGKWLFNCLFIILLCFYVYNGTYSFHLIMGQLMSLYFFYAGVFWLFGPTLVPTLQRRSMLAKPVIWGIRSTVEMFLLDSHHLPDAYEDYPVLFWGCHLLKVAFPSLIRNPILGSISEQSVENCSKRFETHFKNSPIYP